MVQPIACFLLLFFGAALSAQSIESEQPQLEVEKGEEHVLWQKTIKLAKGAKIMNAIRSGDACYFASATRTQVQISKVDATGKTLWERKLDSHQQPRSVILIPRGAVETDNDEGIDVAFPNATYGSLKVASFDREGQSEGEKTLAMSIPEGAIRLADGDVLFFGSTPYNSGNSPQGCAARTNADYEFVWGETYSPSVGFPQKRRRTIEGASLAKAVVLPDDTIALVGQAGIYSKFGTGESRLWILKIDSEGKKVSDAFVDESYFNTYSNLPIHTYKSELLVRHWKASHNPFVEKVVDGDEPKKELWPWISRFDFDLNKIATSELGEKLPPNTATAGGLAPSIFPMLGASSYGENLLLRHANDRGDEVQRVEINQRETDLSHWSKLDFSHGTLWAISEREPSLLHLVMVKSP